MDDRNVGYAQGIGSADIGAFADNLAESLDRQMKIAFEPEVRKSLRRFSSTEVAVLAARKPFEPSQSAQRRQLP